MDIKKANIDQKVDKYEDELYGFEHEVNEPEENEYEEENLEKPFDADKIRIEQRMLSLKYMKELLDNEQLVLAPGFQRNRVWTERKRKSLLIESLMLRIPIPAFYFYEDENSIFYVIDGLQRLSTIQDYLDEKFKLTNLQYLNDACANKKFSELDIKYKTRIYQTQLAINIIDARTPSQVKFDIFRRINTGGVSLRAQEIRNSIAKSHIREFLKRMANSKEFLKATGASINDNRMGAQEMVLRFIAFYNVYNFNTKQVNYTKGEMEYFLDEAFEELNTISLKKLKEYEEAFIRAMSNAYDLFGDYAFRKCYPRDLKPNARRKLINRSLFMSWGTLLSQDALTNLKNRRDKALHILTKEIAKNQDYENSLTKGTNASAKVQFNFKMAARLLERVLADD